MKGNKMDTSNVNTKPRNADSTKKRKRDLLQAERPPFLEPPKPIGHVETFKKNVNYFGSVVRQL